MEHIEKLFLLGGHDLEMLTIKCLLETQALPYRDKHLTWENALLSAYKEELLLIDSSVLIIGIELQADIQVPDNYFSIDHHGLLEGRPSSLEQVAKITHIILDRHMELVAANDKGYIPAMLALNATAEEINRIRCEDRQAQGVTEEDEILAKKAISNQKMVNNLIIVKALSSHFSPICDRLFPFQKLLIYTDREWMFYGKGKKDLENLFATEILKGKIFYGGKENGYIGTIRDAYTKNKLQEMINLIIQKHA